MYSSITQSVLRDKKRCSGQPELVCSFIQIQQKKEKWAQPPDAETLKEQVFTECSLLIVHAVILICFSVLFLCFFSSLSLSSYACWEINLQSSFSVHQTFIQGDLDQVKEVMNEWLFGNFGDQTFGLKNKNKTCSSSFLFSVVLVLWILTGLCWLVLVWC